MPKDPGIPCRLQRAFDKRASGRSVTSYSVAGRWLSSHRVTSIDNAIAGSAKWWKAFHAMAPTRQVGLGIVWEQIERISFPLWSDDRFFVDYLPTSHHPLCGAPENTCRIDARVRFDEPPVVEEPPLA